MALGQHKLFQSITKQPNRLLFFVENFFQFLIGDSIICNTFVKYCQVKNNQLCYL